MLDNPELIKDIRSLGLNTYEVKIWTALLSRGVSTAGELSDIANVPRSRSYDVLESLEKKGFVVMKLGKPIKYLAVPPKEVLERVKIQIEKDKEKHITKINSNSFKGIVDSLQSIHDKASEGMDSAAAVIKGWKNLSKHLEYLFTNVKREIMFTHSPINSLYLPLFNQLKAKQITIKEISLPKSMAQARIYIIDDDNVMLFPLDVEEVHPDYDMGVWIKNKEIVKFLKHLCTSV